MSEYLILKAIFTSAGRLKCDSLCAEDHCIWFHLRNIACQDSNCVGFWIIWSDILLQLLEISKYCCIFMAVCFLKHFFLRLCAI